MSVAAAITSFSFVDAWSRVAVSDTGTAHSTHKVPERGSSATFGGQEIQCLAGKSCQQQHVCSALNYFGFLCARIIVVDRSPWKSLFFVHSVSVAMHSGTQLSLTEPALD